MNFKRTLFLVLSLAVGGSANSSAEVLRYHTLVVDGQNRILPWDTPAANAFDNYLDKCWAWAVAAPNDTHGLPISFLYCAWRPGNPPTADTGWENDVGEKIPNWVESARLYYQYSGDRAPLDYVKRLVDYSLDHGQTPTNHAWPSFPVGTANAGDTEFRGFTNAPNMWVTWDCHVDLAADIGFSMYRLFQIYGDTRYRDKAIHVANVLVTNMVPGTANDSPWPYVINSQTGANHSRYAASWDGALELFDLLIENNQSNVASYTSARSTLKNWLLTYPMQNGNWVDGHSDVKIQGTNNWSATCGSDMCLYLLEHPTWDTNFLTDVPKLLKWTEDNFVNVNTGDGLAGQYHGACVPVEQIAYMQRMGYQAARLGAQYALWYEASGDVTYKDRAYRCFAYNTYMMQTNGQSSDGPTEGVGYWWSDCYGEATRMYYYGMAAVPEWAPPNENHLLRSSSVVISIAYTNSGVSYTTWDATSTELFRLSSVPTNVLANGTPLARRTDLAQQGWTYDANSGVLRVRHESATQIQVIFDPSLQPPTVNLTSPFDGAIFTSPALVTLAADANGGNGSVVKVEFFNGTNKLGEAASSPYSFAWSIATTGSFALTATLTNDHGLTATSSMVNFRVVEAGPAFIGNTNAGSFTDNIWDNGAWINAARFAADTDMTVSNLFAKVTAVTGRYQCAVYSDAGGTANRFLRGTLEVTNPADGWQIFPLTAPLTLTNGNSYWLAIWSDASNARVYADNGGTLRWGRYDYGPWPDPVNLTGAGGYNYCLYASGGVMPGNTNLPAITVDAAQTFQVIDGFGVNANHRSWTNAELRPVLDTLIDQAGMTLFRIVFDNTDWEATNDNADPAVMNWTNFNAIYSAPKFQPLWDMFVYLNQRGLSNGVFLNFMGPAPAWMGGGTLATGMGEEWAETIASLLVYARTTRGLKFSLIAPNNEPDIANEGITMSAATYTNCLHKLADKLDANGLGDVRFVAPDRAGGGTGYMPEMLADPTIMAKLAHFGVHSYSDNGGGSGGVDDFIKNSAYPDRTFWMTEFNVWCNTCDSGQRGNYDWNYCRGTASYLLQHLANGASGGIVWEGYDSFYLHPPSTWSFWGLLAVDNENATPKTYTPRKNFYTVAQISKFIRPGARRIAVSGATTPLAPLLAFHHAGLGQLTLVGVNTSSSAATLRASLASLAAVTNLDLYFTTATTNLAAGGSFAVTNGVFNANIPPDCVFTLVSPALLPKLSQQRQGATLLLSWPTNFADFTPEYATNLPATNWLPHPSLPAVVNGQLIITSPLSAPREFHRLKKP